MNTPTQERRTETIGASVTPTEKRLVDLAAMRLGVEKSVALRSHNLTQLIEIGQRIMSAVEGVPVERVA